MQAYFVVLTIEWKTIDGENQATFYRDISVPGGMSTKDVFIEAFKDACLISGTPQRDTTVLHFSVIPAQL